MLDRRVSFVCNPHFWVAGSVYLRGFQLAQLAARRFPSVQVRKLGDLGSDVDEVLIVNKSCLTGPAMVRVHELLPTLRGRSVCIADPLDAALPDAALAGFDGVIAASQSQADYLSERLPCPVFLVHHHVDLRLPPAPSDLGRARAGYFGELINTQHADELADRVDFIAIDTANALDMSWMGHLPYYNLHYCLRRARTVDGFKPATKIFVAAAMGALVIAERADAEAARLLPADYPFFVESADVAHVRRVVDRALNSYGSDEWLRAQAAMAAIRCYQPEPILDALEDMIRSVTAYDARSGIGEGRRSASIAT